VHSHLILASEYILRCFSRQAIRRLESLTKCSYELFHGEQIEQHQTTTASHGTITAKSYCSLCKVTCRHVHKILQLKKNLNPQTWIHLQKTA